MLNNKIIIFTDWYVPGNKAGGPIQSVYNMAQLLSKSFDVKIVTRNKDYQSATPYQNINFDTWQTIETNHSVLYLSEQQVNFKRIKTLVKENKGNILFINGLFSFYFSFLPLIFSLVFNCKKTFVAVRGMLHQSALSVKPSKKYLFLAFARGFGLYKSCTLISSSINETKEIINVLGPKVKVQEIANIPLLINELYFNKKEFKSQNHELRVLFLGRISQEKNPITLLKALNLFEKPCNVTFCGSQNNLDYFNTFKSLFDNLPNHIQKTYIQELPHEQIKSLFLETDVMVLPSLGENFGHAIFESLAFSTPVIVGNNTIWNHLEEQKIGFEIEPLSHLQLLEKLNLISDFTQSQYEDYQNNAFQKALNFYHSNNFEENYNKLFS